MRFILLLIAPFILYPSIKADEATSGSIRVFIFMENKTLNRYLIKNAIFVITQPENCRAIIDYVNSSRRGAIDRFFLGPCLVLIIEQDRRANAYLFSNYTSPPNSFQTMKATASLRGFRCIKPKASTLQNIPIHRTPPDVFHAFWKQVNTKETIPLVE